MDTDNDSSGDQSNVAGSQEQQDDARINYEQAIRDVKERERELSRRTEALENMMALYASTLSGARVSEPSTSTPIQPALKNAPPPLNFATPSGHACTAINSSLNVTSPSVISGYPNSYIRDALDLVPQYDGHNIPVWQFARACKRARQSIPVIDEAVLVRMLRNKLSHHAYLAVEDETHFSVDQLLDSLKRVFGPGKDANYYRGQLSSVYKKPTEHILDYNGRVKDLRTAIIEGEQTNLNRTLSNAEISSVDSFTMDAFYEGLPREYRVELRAEGYHSFADACAKIITIHKRLEREEARYKNPRNLRDSSAPTHRTFQRDSPATATNLSTSIPIPSTDIQGNTAKKICNYCKNIGHLIHECRKRQYREGNLNSSYANNNNYGNNFARGNNDFPRNNYNNNNFTSRNETNQPGNHPEVSVNGTNRGLGNARPVLPVNCAPGPSTSYEPTMQTYLPSSSNLLPSEDQLPSCSTQEHNLI